MKNGLSVGRGSSRGGSAPPRCSVAWGFARGEEPGHLRRHPSAVAHRQLLLLRIVRLPRSRQHGFKISAVGRYRSHLRHRSADVARRDVAGVGLSCDVVGSGGLALGEVDRAAGEVGDAMVSRRDFDRPVAGSGGEASLRRGAVMRGLVVGGGVAVGVLAWRAIGHGEPARWLLVSGSFMGPGRGRRWAYGCSWCTSGIVRSLWGPRRRRERR
jgi:hypothetical protein